MACNVIIDGNKIPVEQFAAELHNGLLDQLVGEGRIDMSKFVQPLQIDESKMSKSSDIQKQVYNLAKGLSQKGVSDNKLITEVSKYLSDKGIEVDNSDDIIKGVADYRGREYDLNLTSDKRVSSKYLDRIDTMNLSEEEKVKLKSDLSHETLDADKVISAVKTFVDKSLEDRNYLKKFVDDLGNPNVSMDPTFRDAAIIKIEEAINKKIIESGDSSLKEIHDKLISLGTNTSITAGRSEFIRSVIYNGPEREAYKYIQKVDLDTDNALSYVNDSGESNKDIIKESKKELFESLNKSDVTDELQDLINKEVDRIVKERLLEQSLLINKDVKNREKKFRESRKEQYNKDKRRYFNSGLPILNEAGITYGIDIAKSYIREGISDLDVIKKKLSLFFDNDVRKIDLERIINRVKDTEEYAVIKDNKAKTIKGTPVWDSYREEAAKSLLSKLKDKSYKESAPLQEFIQRLNKNLSERFKSDKIKKGNTDQDIESNIKEVLENLSYYNEVIEQTKEDILKSDISGLSKMDKLAKLSIAVGDIFDKPLSDASLKRYLNKMLKDNGMTLSTFTKKSWEERDAYLAQFIDELSITVGEIDALKLRDSIYESFIDIIDKRSSEILNKALSKLDEPKNKDYRIGIVKYANNKILDLIYQGALNDDTFNDVMYDAMNIPYITKNQKIKLLEYSKEIGEAPDSAIRHRIQQEFTNYLHEIELHNTKFESTFGRLFNGRTLQRFVEGSIALNFAQTLSSSITALVANKAFIVKQIMTLVVDDIGKNIVKKDIKGGEVVDVLDLKELLKASLKIAALPGYIPVKIAKSMHQTASMIVSGYKDKNINSIFKQTMLYDGFNLADSDIEANRSLNWYTKATGGNLFKLFNADLAKTESNVQRVAGGLFVGVTAMNRALVASDMVNRLATNDYFVANKIYRDALFKGDEAKIHEEFQRQYDYYKNEKEKFISIAQELIDERKLKGQKVIESDKLKIAYDLMQQNDEWHDLLTEAKKLGKEQSEQQDPEKTSLSYIYQIILPISKLSQGVFFKFMRTSFNFMDTTLDWSPYGFVRAARGKSMLANTGLAKTQHGVIAKLDQPREAKKRIDSFIKASLSLMTGVAMYSLSRFMSPPDEDDESELAELRRKIQENFIFRINGEGYGSKNFKLNQELAEKGRWEANTITIGIGDNITNMRYDYWPSNAIYSYIGNVLDWEKYGSKLSKDDQASYMEMLFDSMFRSSMSRTLGEPAKFTNELLKGGFTSKGLTKTTATVMKPFIPLLGAALTRDLTNLSLVASERGFESRPDYEQGIIIGAYKTFARNTPLIFLDNERGFDSFGKPILVNLDKLPLSPISTWIVKYIDEWKETHLYDDSNPDSWIYKMIENGVPLSFKKPSTFSYSGLDDEQQAKLLVDSGVLDKTIFNFGPKIKKWYPDIDEASFTQKYNLAISLAYMQGLRNSRKELESFNDKERLELINKLQSKAKQVVKESVMKQIGDKNLQKVIKESKISLKSRILIDIKSLGVKLQKE